MITRGRTVAAHLNATQANPRMRLSTGFPPLAFEKCLLREVRDGGAGLQWVWLGETAAVAGLAGTGPGAQAFDL